MSTIIDYDGSSRTYDSDKKLHSFDDQPAIVHLDGTKEWYCRGLGHRSTLGPDGKILPSVIYANGGQIWQKNGMTHRSCKDEDGNVLPAVIQSDGLMLFYDEGRQYTISDGKRVYASPIDFIPIYRRKNYGKNYGKGTIKKYYSFSN